MEKLEKISEKINLINKFNDKFEIYYQNLVSYNEKVNLTAITEKNEVYTKHFLDSILPIDEIPLNCKVIDIGAGAGFPSLPIKIVRDDINLTMLDSLNKRISFLNFICNKLNVKSTNIHSRAEDHSVKFREKYDIAVARAVAKLNTLLEYMLPLIKIGGKVIAYKGSNIEEELKSSEKALDLLGGKVIKTIKFNLPNEVGERNIIVIEKIKPTPTQYPRSQNKPKTNPIM